ncbi:MULTISPECIES: helix-turn-helix transcriptional regulator [unclassified Modicisalibacter]|uniref:helix-turn-helix transcriptional regulator n=1 Tax=unclassified Modicisalibacter TaxID=2679913 RepID=UPI001CCD7D0A|nr:MULTISPECIES: helix-turn-helix transcriptional regulator [unclassified Modicisalibacter]MBZ9558042.1 helix-turn-helix transcriptional regulator [Modicisalibacter sp. R2A 31.J]MBZ9573290.1 helix-turn-helix transcriptional regulator [Modicisalibacter sp. MOD 31.J]
MSSPATATHAATPTPRRLTIADFTAYERRYHLTHRFPVAPDDRCGDELTIAEGRVDEHRPGRGCQLVGSDLVVHRTYETHARRDAPAHLSIIVMLEGRAELALDEHRQAISAGDGLVLAYGRDQALRARHVAQPRVRAVNLTLTADALAGDPRLAALARAPFEAPATGMWRLSIPAGLHRSLGDWLDAPPPGDAGTLLSEGLALQLLACGVSQWPRATESPALLPWRDRRLLDRVRQRLEAQPGQPHSLASLAELACMSPSTLREKFRLAYGRSVFAYLRECRLALAHRQLRAGLSVQQVALQVGYRHATNFATAFRQRYGVSPSEIG